jgi:hypothetical protein
MENELRALPLVFVASVVLILLTYIFVLPRLPGITFAKTAWHLAIACLVATAQTISTTVLFFCFGYPALYLGFWLGLTGGATAYPSWFATALAVLVVVSCGFSFLWLMAAEFIASKSTGLTHWASRLLAALVLTLPQMAIGGAIFYAAEKSAPVGKAGYIDKEGNYAIARRFEHVEDFRHGIARVNLPKDFTGRLKAPAFIDHSGNNIKNPEEGKRFFKFSAGSVAFGLDNEEGAANTGNSILVRNHGESLPLAEGLSAVQKAGAPPQVEEAWGFEDSDHKMVIPPSFYDVRSFKEGLAAAAIDANKDNPSADITQVNALWGYIDRQGNWVVKPQFQNAESFSDGLGCVSVSTPGAKNPNGTKVGYINKKGEFVIPPKFDYGNPFREGVAAVVVEPR